MLGYQARQKTEPKPVAPSVSLSHNNLSLTDDQICLLRTLTEEPMLADDLIELTGIPTRRVLSAPDRAGDRASGDTAQREAGTPAR